MACGVAAGAALLAALGREGGRDGEAATALAAAGLMAAVGLADDRFHLDARLKLLVGALAAAAAVLGLSLPRALPLAPGLDLPLPWGVAAAGAVLWLVTVTNAVNFMDGADGLVPGGLPILFAALGAACWAGGAAPLAVPCALACAAYGGFLPWNLAGRLFQGDAGSLYGGFLLAALALAAAGRGAAPLLFGPVLLLPWLTDVLLTLLRRARAGRPLLQAHREHLYQRWLQATGRPHLALAWRNAGVLALAAAAGLAMRAAPWSWQGPLFAGTLALCIGAWTAASRRLDRRLAAP